MYTSRSIEHMNPKNQSKLFMNALGPTTRLRNPQKDPFESLSCRGPSKLLPISPSGMHLPKIQRKEVWTVPQRVSSTQQLIFQKPKLDKQINLSEKQLRKNELLVPITPKGRLKWRHQSTTHKIYHEPIKRNSMVEIVDVSFGINN